MANYSAGVIDGVEVGSVHEGSYPDESMFDCAAVVSIGETPQEASGNIRDIPLFVRDLP